MPDSEQLGQIETYSKVAYADFWDFTDESGAAVSVAGNAYTCHVRSGTPDEPGAVVLSVSTANSKLTVSGSRLSIALSATDLAPAGLPVGDYYFELVDVTGGGANDVIERGWWCHRPSGVGRD